MDRIIVSLFAWPKLNFADLVELDRPGLDLVVERLDLSGIHSS